MLAAFVGGVVVGLIGLAMGWRMGYSVGRQDGRRGEYSPWPWSDTETLED